MFQGVEPTTGDEAALQPDQMAENLRRAMLLEPDDMWGILIYFVERESHDIICRWLPTFYTTQIQVTLVRAELLKGRESEVFKHFMILLEENVIELPDGNWAPIFAETRKMVTAPF